MFNATDSTRTMSALLVACDDDNKGPVLDLLLVQPVQLAIVGSTEEAEARFADMLPDVVFLLDSSSLDAFALLERMRKRWGCRVHGVIIGGNDDRAAWKKALSLGAADYLPLPLDAPSLQDTLNRIGEQIQTCADTSRQLLDASRLTQVFDALPWGVVLIGAGERIIRSSRTADELLHLSGRPLPKTLEELLATLFGPNNHESFLEARAALSSGQTWRETVFLGQKTLALQLTVPVFSDSRLGEYPCGLLTLLDMNQAMTSGTACRPALVAAAIDLLLSRHLPPREQGHLAEIITDGALPVPEPFDLRQLLEECRKQACQSCVNPVTVSLHIADQVPTGVSGQLLVLRETLLALLEWAGRESGNGSVTFSLSVQGQHDNAVSVRFKVSAVERRLTRSSYRRGEEYIVDELGRSGQGAFKQTRGIGLATILASRLGSNLILRSVAREGKTASFDLWLNRATPPMTVDSTPSAARPENAFLVWDAAIDTTMASGGLRILVAEDNPLEQRSLESVLTKLGHSAVIVSNGREAVEEFEQNQFDIVLLDILMPVMDGFEAVRLIREREQRLDQHTPVLALTSYSLKAVQERCSRSGMNGYISKPVTVEKAEHIFRQFVNRPVTAQMPETTADSGVQSPVLDYSNLEYDKELYREMVDLFITHGLPLFSSLEGLLESGGPVEELHQTAHKLKGMTANIGAIAVNGLMRELQDASAGSGPLDYNRFLNQLRQARPQLVLALNSVDWDSYR